MKGLGLFLTQMGPKIDYAPREKKLAKTMAKIELCDEVCGQARVRTIDKLDEACHNADDQMMLVRHRSGDHFMS